MSDPIRLEVRDRGVITPISIGAGILETEFRSFFGQRSGGRGVIVARRVAELWGEKLRAALEPADAWIELDDSEDAKSLHTAGELLDVLFSKRLRRDWTIVCAGGGVTGDLGAFVASIALRGVAVVHVPTTLLAQVDSSIGGKTGVNHPGGKNLIGSFHPPAAVITDIDFLSTLERDQIRGGLFEALKCGVIADEALFESVVSYEYSDERAALQSIVTGAVAVKCRVVTNDPREAGERRLLNYGHTLGHALEKVLEYRGISHGDAVGRGMVAANEIGRALGVTPSTLCDRVSRAVDVLGPAPLPRKVTAEELIEAAQLDKKFDTRTMRVVVPSGMAMAEVIAIEDHHLRIGAEALARQALAGDQPG